MRVFITGITGTLGTAIADLHLSKGDKVSGCARNEEKAMRWVASKPDIKRIHLGDAVSCTDHNTEIGRDALRCDRFYHFAAMKHVDLCERNPYEAWKQNVELTSKLSVTFRDRMVFASSDKACPVGGIGVYGASKLTGERMTMLTGGAVVRLGNLIGSSGSVLQSWKAADRIRLTDPNMTRYFIPVKEAAKLCHDALSHRLNFLATMKAIRMGDLANAFDKPCDVVGTRPGETQHQWLIAPGEVVGWLNGLHSATAERWDVQELLKEAMS